MAGWNWNKERATKRIDAKIDVCVPKIRFGVDAAIGRRKLAS
jgi:hypothetical protein